MKLKPLIKMVKGLRLLRKLEKEIRRGDRGHPNYIKLGNLFAEFSKTQSGGEEAADLFAFNMYRIVDATKALNYLKSIGYHSITIELITYYMCIQQQETIRRGLETRKKTKDSK